MALGLRQREAFDDLEAAWRGHAGETPSLIPAQDNNPREHKTSACPELDCVRDLLPRAIIEDAERRSADIGVGADRVLICSGALDEHTYLRRLADAHGFLFEPLDDVLRDRCALDDDRLIDAAAAGILPLHDGDQLVLAVSPRGFAVRRILALIDGNPALIRRFRLASSAQIQDFVFRHGETEIGNRAAHALHDAWPVMSAAPPRWRQTFSPLIVTGMLAIIAALVAPGPVMAVFEVALAAVFLAWMALRVAGTLVHRPQNTRPADIPDRELPVYTIMVALYREAAAVDGLIAALRQLDYPAEKLDIKLIVEHDDAETRAALGRYQLAAPFEIIVAPDIGPRTKPKALNVALPFARGTFAVVYDAEDRPEPDQLRRALDTFIAQDDDLACVQACLTIDNSADNWLTALFTAEYAGQFDVFLPALAVLRMPLPLGGSSNHFRTARLRAVGGWDAYNVTEDADLGMRLARFGFRSSIIRATTFEEAPARLGPWLRQRTRWFKGWMQTWLVHMREPRRLLRDLRLPAFMTFQLMVGGNVIAALVHPIFLAWFVHALLSKGPIWQTQGMAALFGVTVLFGYCTSALLAAVGLLRRGLPATIWVLVLTPLHWTLLALAAWRALYQLVRDPYRWEKTEHGLARTSRRSANESRQISVETMLRQAAARQQRERAATYNGAGPPLLPAASA